MVKYWFHMKTSILVIRAKDGLNNPNGYTHSKVIKFSYTNIIKSYNQGQK